MLLFLEQTFVHCKDVKLTLEKHPAGLMCTIYATKMFDSDSDLWNRVIDDNRASSVLCLSTNGTKAPVPTIKFLERCSINMIVGRRDPFPHYIYFNLHIMRSPFHSKFIIVTGHDCNFFSYKKENAYLGQIFYYFSFCQFADSSTFPNAFVDYFDTSNEFTSLFVLGKHNKYSIHSSQPPLGKEKYGRIMFTNDGTGGKHGRFYRRNCKTLTFHQRNRETTEFCPPNWQVYNLFESSQFNLSLTWNPTLRSKAPGKIFVNKVLVLNSLSYHLYQFAESVSIFNEYETMFFYCVPKARFKLMSFEALIAPFDLLTWMGLLSLSAILTVVGIHPAKIREYSEKLLYIFRLLLEQDIEVRNIWGTLVCLSVAVLINVYKMDVTSNLLVPSKVIFKDNLSALFQKGYKYLYPFCLCTKYIICLCLCTKCL